MALRRGGWLIAAALLAAGCAGPMSAPGSGDFSPQPERTLYLSLKEVDATEPQRLAVLNAFDRFDDRLRDLARRSQELTAQWRAIDRRDPAFIARSQELSKSLGALAGERLVAESEFERDVAATLSPEQFSRWQSYMAARSGPARPRDMDYDRSPTPRY